MAMAKRSIGYAVLQIALGLFFIVTGIWTLQGGTGNEIATAINKVFSGDVRQIVRIVFAIIEVLAGVFLILRIFMAVASSLDTILMVIIMIAWICAIVLLDFISGNFSNILTWLNRFAYHLLVLGAVIVVKD